MPESTVTLHRGFCTNQGTTGVLTTPGFTCFTLELPWRGNHPNISCIPAGRYVCRLAESPRFGRVFHVCDVPDRTHILIHPGNFAGDVTLDYRSDVAGCILLGRRLGYLYGQRAVIVSRTTVRRFMGFMEGQGLSTFTLDITED